jgi:hypothetical protein
MVAGDPLRVQQRQRARLHRKGFVHAKNALRGVAGIDMQRHGADVGRVLRWWHLIAAHLLRANSTGS